ncbi:hypothetical protein Val02_00040 [Virgisporangium aliadipatigenens]|uniref:vWA-MoxR associated protein C-terminal domain-containing protein n=1 Tax=Virgisporangium aliadipatigenens TaxID=741659 RepID=A0A8J3YFK6_9ACTN|nr:trypsin-like peptidase domain-containing protein [Virgisporangium aliadipatigenens]GIJ43118.1 hypothetical protein Val02_00040 [Virgisporangium aliadipatigenens]
MAPAQWPARVAGGAGFLVERDRVLTAAHVVEGLDAVDVRFPARRELGAIPATVEFTGPWRRSGEPDGDLAVLRLHDPVDIAPARFAACGALEARPKAVLHVVGFPAADGIERVATVQVDFPTYLVQGEWAQLRSDESFGPAVGKGYSGAAVTIAGTGEVVGMVTAADRQDRIGHMLTAARLRAHWAPLAALLPLGPLAAPAHRELRAGLDDVPVEKARAAARSATGDDHAEPDPAALAGARSAYDVAAYLVERLAAPHRAEDLLKRFLAALAAPPAAPGEVTVSVQVSRSGAGPRKVLLGIRLYSGGRPLAEVCHEVVTAARLRARVEELLPHAIDERVPPDCRVTVEFVLPRAWLSLPVDSWAERRGSSVQLGWRHPVTVRDLARYQRKAPDREHDRRWAHLDRGGDVVHWIGCRDAVEAARLAATLAVRAERAVLALASPPDPVERHPALRAGFDSGMPVMLWRRAACPAHCDGDDCPGRHFRSRLTDRISLLPSLTELPALTCALRAEAGPDGGDPMTLLWEPPLPRTAAPTLGLGGTS